MLAFSIINKINIIINKTEETVGTVEIVENREKPVTTVKI